MHFIKWLNEISDEGIGAGSKASNLGRLAKHRFNVPEAFCVTIDAYDAFAAVHDVGAKVESILDAADLSKPQEIKAASRQIRSFVESHPIPDAVSREVIEAYGRLGIPSVVVRSSAPLEDLATASFAGQYDSYINVSDPSDILCSIRSVWSSLWSPRSIAYRRLKRLDSFGASMAVLVQAFIDAEAGGVLFTADPLSQESGLMIIEGNWGLGDAVTSGSVDPDRFWIDRRDLKVVRQTIASKSMLRAPKEEGSTVDQPIPSPKRNAPCLSEEAVLELAKIGQRVESFLGSPQDVEWAYFDGEFYVIQSRPLRAAASAT